MAEGNTLTEEESAWDRHAREYLENKLSPRFSLIESEKAVAVNWSTGEARFIDVRDRQYPDFGPGWYYGTMDLLCHGLTTVYVGDWKTGGTDGAEEQLLSLLAASVRANPWLRKDGTVKFFISCLEVNERGVWPHEREVSIQELDAHWQAMAWASENLGKEYKPIPGIWCTALFCPHLAYCNAINDLAMDLAEMPEAKLNKRFLMRSYRITGKPSSPEEASYTMERLSAANRQVKYLTECMKEYVNNGGQVISGQWQWAKGKDGFRWRKIKQRS